MRYFFHLQNEVELIEDEVGVEHDDNASAMAEADAAAREMIADMFLANEPIEHHVFRVVDELGTTIGEVPLKSLVLNFVEPASKAGLN